MGLIKKMVSGANIPALRRERKAAAASKVQALKMEANAGIQSPFRSAREILGSLKKGGKVNKTGVYLLHKGEKVTPAKKGY